MKKAPHNETILFVVGLLCNFIKIVKLCGGGVGFKTEHRHRGMKLGIAPHSSDYWGRQLAAGGAGLTKVERFNRSTFQVDS